MGSQPQNFGLSPDQRLAPSIERFLQLAERIFEGLHVALPAVVKSFNPGPPAKVKVQPALRSFVLNSSSQSELSMQTQAIDLPLLEDVPVFFLTGGGWSITAPIAEGDECILLFADSAIDIWLQNGGTANNPITQRRHDLSDAFAICGLRSTPRGLASYSQSSMQIRSDDQSVMIDLAASGITVTAPDVTVNATDKVTINAPTQVKIGSITEIDNRIFMNHYHIAPAGGGPTSGVV